jgi:hypothetical protein
MSDTAPASLGNESVAVLPQALRDLVRRVVRKARLWPSEQRELIAELESHFREGLIELAQDGVTVKESIEILLDGFGDPDLTAKLIHRSKKRGRPMIWKIFTTTVLVFVAVGAAGGGYLAYVSIGTPTPTVDYIAKINEPTKKIPEGDRAWPVLREALLQFRPMPKELEAAPKSLPRPAEEKWPAALAWVESNRSILPLLKDAASKPTYGFVYDNEQTLAFMRLRAQAKGEKPEPAAEPDPLAPPTIAIILPQLSELRNVAKFLVLDAREHLARGEFADAWSALDISHRLGAQLFTGQTIIEQLVGVAMMSMATNEMRAVLRQTGEMLTARDLALVKASHLATMPICAIKGDFRAEMFFFNDTVQYVFTDDGNGNGHLIPSQFAKLTSYWGQSPENQKNPVVDTGMLATAAIHADRRETIAKYHETWTSWRSFIRYRFTIRGAEANSVWDSIKGDGPAGRASP